MHGKFRTKFDLRAFPFDSQKLCVSIMSDEVFYKPPKHYSNFRLDNSAMSKYKNWRLVMRQKKESDSMVLASPLASIWYIQKRLGMEPALTPFTASGTGCVYPLLEISATASRNPTFYMYSTVFMLFIIVSMAGVVFFLREDANHGDRFEIILTLVLTTVAFKFSTKEQIPCVSYLTYLDKYNIFAMLVLCLVVIESMAITQLDGDIQFDIEQYVCVCVHSGARARTLLLAVCVCVQHQWCTGAHASACRVCVHTLLLAVCVCTQWCTGSARASACRVCVCVYTLFIFLQANHGCARIKISSA